MRGLCGGGMRFMRAGVNVIDLKSARRIALKMVLGQLAVTAAIAALFWIWSGGLAAVSALTGGGIGIAAALAMVAFMFRETAPGDAKAVMRNAYKGEAAKLGLTVVLFALVLKFLELAALPLFVAYIATLLMHWVALAKA